MIIGILVGTLVLASAAILIGGAFTSTSFSVIGWPGNERPVQPIPDDLDLHPASPSRTGAVQPTRTAGASPTPRRTSPTPSPARTPGPTATPTRTGPTATRSATPQPSDTPTTSGPSATDDGHTPPGHTKEPPGLDPDKTRGPKQ